jgi:hypothetical protein
MMSLNIGSSVIACPPMEHLQKTAIAREWIIFAISLGLGGHVVLGLMLHAPDIWSWNEAGLQGLLIGLSAYVAVQLSRSVWWVVRGSRRSQNAEIGTDDRHILM